MGNCFSSYGVHDSSPLQSLSYFKNLEETQNCTCNVSACNSTFLDRTHFSDGALSQLLGVGGFGMVRLVEKKTGPDQHVKYAMKSLSKAAVLNRDSAGLCSTITELRALRRVRGHPFICDLHYAFQDSCFLYLILDLSTCGDLRMHLWKAPRKHFSETLSRILVMQVLEAVQHCHTCNVLHRDIKPENILMCVNGNIKLTDFGVARILGNLEECRSTSGTHGYMAPEIYMSDHKHGIAADWFSVGITLHELLLGRRPFEIAQLQSFRDTSQTKISLELDFSTFLDPKLSSNAKDLLRKLLRATPYSRIGAVDGLDEIRLHPWFSSFSWTDLLNGKLSSNFKPHQYVDGNPNNRTLIPNDISNEELQNLLSIHSQSLPIPRHADRRFHTYHYRTSLGLQNDNEESKTLCGSDDDFERHTFSAWDKYANDDQGIDYFHEPQPMTDNEEMKSEMKALVQSPRLRAFNFISREKEFQSWNHIACCFQDNDNNNNNSDIATDGSMLKTNSPTFATISTKQDIYHQYLDYQPSPAPKSLRLPPPIIIVPSNFGNRDNQINEMHRAQMDDISSPSVWVTEEDEENTTF